MQIRVSQRSSAMYASLSALTAFPGSFRSHLKLPLLFPPVPPLISLGRTQLFAFDKADSL